MTFTEEVPSNRKPYLPCKRRCCPYQELFEQKQLNGLPPKLFYTYRCKDFVLWQRCLRQIDPNESKPAKQAKPKKENANVKPK